jgi:hypothetical protein
MKSDADTFILLWGGPISPPSAKRVLYWAINEKGALCGVIMPATVWSRVEKALSEPSGLEAPYLSIAVSGLSTPNPELVMITLGAETVYDFCYLKNAIYRLRRTPQKLKVDPASLMTHIGLADVPPMVSLKRFGSRPEKGEFFTFLPDKSRLELYYLIEEGDKVPSRLGVQVLWAIKGYGLPVVARGTGYRPPEDERALLDRSAVKPLPLWLRNMGRLFKRRRI